MDINELVNPAAEAHQIFDATDEDIYEAVMDAKKVREALEKSSDLHGESDSDEVVEPMITRDEALQAALSLRKFTKYLNDPFARKLEVMLGSFGQQMRATAIRNTKDTKLTSYFGLKE
ncbi:hypothetical protein OG21DRAFT_1507444 [Imleria badia]|nr:hypothetical protein OG21DRAFT_1507444 [Imleria badia]